MVPVADFYRKNKLKCKVLEDAETQKIPSMKTVWLWKKSKKNATNARIFNVIRALVAKKIILKKGHY